MAKLDARKAAALLANPPAECRVVLLHGDDPGLVRERADALVAKVSAGDDLRIVDVPKDAAKDHGLLRDEAASFSLTGGRRVVRVRDAGDAFAAAAKAALAGPGPGLVVLEAGELKPNKTGLRGVLEAAEAAAVITCYRERGSELAGSIGRILQDLGVGAESAALDWLAQRLGEDRMVMRRELEKLALYVGPGGTASADDVLACVAEGSAMDLEEALLAVFAGEVARADAALGTAFAEGAASVQVVRGALRHVQRLSLAALAVQGGAAPTAALEALRPPIFFRHKPAVERALRLWSPAMLEAAGSALLDAERRAKTTGLPDETVTRMAMLNLARQAARASRR